MTDQNLVDRLSQPPSQNAVPICKLALPIENAAKLEALTQLYPDQDVSTLMTELIHHALHSLNRDQ